MSDTTNDILSKLDLNTADSDVLADMRRRIDAILSNRKGVKSISRDAPIEDYSYTCQDCERTFNDATVAGGYKRARCLPCAENKVRAIKRDSARQRRQIEKTIAERKPISASGFNWLNLLSVEMELILESATNGATYRDKKMAREFNRLITDGFMTRQNNDYAITAKGAMLILTAPNNDYEYKRNFLPFTVEDTHTALQSLKGNLITPSQFEVWLKG